MLAVPKPSGDLCLPKGFRPISILSCALKVLERIVADHLTFSLEADFIYLYSSLGFATPAVLSGLYAILYMRPA